MIQSGSGESVSKPKLLLPGCLRAGSSLESKPTCRGCRLLLSGAVQTASDVRTAPSVAHRCRPDLITATETNRRMARPLNSVKLQTLPRAVLLDARPTT